MRVITLNLNGIRSATQKGALDWIRREQPDVVLLQEVRAVEAQIPALPEGYAAHWNAAERPGYSGVGVLYNTSTFPNGPNRVVAGTNNKEFDPEGRVLRLEFGHCSVISAYLPSGSSGEERQAAKLRFLKRFLPWLKQLRQDHVTRGLGLLLAGDFNIAHKQIDLKNWRGNQNSSGFTPEERAWMDALLAAGFHDTYREQIGPDVAQYSWWSNRGQARANDVGWRLDYHITTPDLASVASTPRIHRELGFSDHAPVELTYKL